MNKKHIILTFLLLTIILIAEIPAITSAASLKYKLNGGIGNYGKNRRYYYIDSSCNAEVTAKINTAWSDWIYTSITTPISTRQTTTKSQSVFDFYIYNDNLFSTAEAFTEFYINPSTQISPSLPINAGLSNTQNWDWTNIKLHHENFFTMDERFPGRSFDMQKAVIAHEIGHAMGLIHTSETELSIMRMGTVNLYVDKCTELDLQTINALYGGN